MPRSCKPGTKKSAKLVRGCDGKMKCVRYGARGYTIKKHIQSRKRSFCRRHLCSEKTNPATPGYQSCLAWDCKVGSACSRKQSKKTKTTKRQATTKTTKRKPTKRKPTKRKLTKTRSPPAPRPKSARRTQGKQAPRKKRTRR